MARYLIAGVMLFDDELYEVSQTDSPARPVMLGAAASRCFSTLLEAQGAIVTKKELLHAGWERYGQQVSTNSVNQSIAQIRRCLSQVGQCDCVVTVPRIGYKISDALSIKRLGDSTLTESHLTPGNKRDVKPLAVMPGGEVAVVRHKKQHFVWAYVWGMALLLLNVFLAFGWQGVRTSSPLSTAIEFNYLPVPGTQNLKLFSAPGLSVSPERINTHLLKLKNKPPVLTSLASYGYVYLNGALRDNVYSYFLCREPIEASIAGCISYFIADESE